MAGDIERLLGSLGEGQVLENYIIPGLRSRLLATHSAGKGKVRVFEMSREQDYDITPHDHRYGFQCYVVRGSVMNRSYHVRPAHQPFAKWASLPYDCVTRELDTERPSWFTGRVEDATYRAGDWYSMSHDEFHAIRFSADARVLLIEGPEVKATSSCLLPYVNGRICNTFVWRDWMMQPAQTAPVPL